MGYPVSLPVEASAYSQKSIRKSLCSLTKLVRDLGRGETAVILLGLENPDSLVVLDDDLARKVARELGVKVTGTVGVLINAKGRGIIKAVRPYLDRLEDLGFYLAPEHRLLILREVGED